MPVSHLTLTVSHLPTSTSFFLSCLQPLGYKFIGRHDEFIGFGSKADEPADFWLAQEQPGTPAGAAHIAFPAPSKEAVNTFFICALKAGGKIHGEPKTRDHETGYFSAAVIDFDGNSIEAVYRSSGHSTSDAVSLRGGPSAMQTGSVKNGSVVSRARSTRTESVMQRDRAVHAIENIPASRVKMLYDQEQKQQSMYQSYPTQTQTDNTGNNNSISAKTIIGTLLGATAGAAIAYAMMKGDSSSSTSTSAPPTIPNSQGSFPEPIPMPAQTQYIQQQLPAPPQQSQPHQMSMSLPMLMPMLGPAPGSAPAAFQEQQPVYRAIEAPPTAAARSTFTANDAISAYTRSSGGSKNKSPRADTIYEDTEYYPSVEGGPQLINGGGSIYSQEPTTMSGGGSGIRRTANGSMYATRDLPIRAIEYTSGMSAVSQSQLSSSSSQKTRSKSYPCDPSTFISSYAEQQQQQGHIIGDAESEFSSISTIKPAKSSASASHRSSTSSSHARSEKRYHHSNTSSHHSSTSSSHRSSKSSSKHHHHHQHRYSEEEEREDPGAVPATVYSTSSSSSRMTAHKIALPDSKPGSTYSALHSSMSTSKRSSKSASNAGASRYSAHEIPLPESAAPSTVFLDAVDDADDPENIITPDDSISQVGISNNENTTKSSSGRSHRSKSGPSSTPSTTSSRRDKESKFDQPIKPSDSISQVSSNIHARSRVSERSERTVKASSKVHSVKSGSRH